MFGLPDKKAVDGLLAQIETLQKDIARLDEEVKKKDYFLDALHAFNDEIIDVKQENILEKSLDVLTKHLHAHRGIIFLEDTDAFIARAFRNFDQALFKDFKILKGDDVFKIISECKQPITISELGKKLDMSNKQHYAIINMVNPEIIAPLIVKEAVVGFIALSGHQGATAFSDEGLRLLRSVSNQLAVAVSNMRLTKTLEEVNKELYAKMFELINLHRVSDAISSVVDLDRIKQLTIDMFAEIIGSKKAILFLKTEAEHKFMPVSWKGITEDIRGIDFNVNAEFIAFFLSQKQILQLDPARIRDSLVRFKCDAFVAQTLETQGLFLFVPFFSNEKLVALLALGKSATQGPIPAHEIKSLATLSSLAAVTIDNANLYELSVQDGLTGVYIHRYFQQCLEYKLTAGFEHLNRRVISLLMVDIDFFKDINDTFGHQAGDQILKDVAKIITNNVRMVDVIARYGGEEFAVILPELDLQESAAIAEKIRASIEAFKFFHNDTPIQVTVSLGVATFPDHAVNKDELIKQADMALYKSKEAGRNRLTLCAVKDDNPAETTPEDPPANLY
ncbi:MAG: sensor domain-containing diguanylate cyclase [Candidatus Omnitrophica bacterium]|nr:sensor domain-containing diguanylate cyclase [Candidatus Omnitrophota bacterium]